MIMDFVDFFQSNISEEFTFYPNHIPIGNSGEAGSVRLAPNNTQRRANLMRMNVQVIVRTFHPEHGERLGFELLRNIGSIRTNFKIGEIQVVQFDTKSVFPLYIGKDENDRYKYSMDFSLLIEN